MYRFSPRENKSRLKLANLRRESKETLCAVSKRKRAGSARSLRDYVFVHFAGA
jgi:hypothetical protein